MREIHTLNPFTFHSEAGSYSLRMAVTEQLNATLCKPVFFDQAAILTPVSFDELYLARHLLHHNLATVYRNNNTQKKYLQFRRQLHELEQTSGLSLADYLRITILKGSPCAMVEDPFPGNLPPDTDSSIFWHEPDLDWRTITDNLTEYFEGKLLEPEDIILFTRPFPGSTSERIQGVHGSIEHLPHIHIWTRTLQTDC